MNLFVILLLIISLGGSAWIGFEPIENWLERFMAVLAIAATVPAMALFQSGIVLQRFRNKNFGNQDFESTCRRMTVAHSVVWLAASAAIIWGLRWQDVVRGTWELGRWPVLDELVILLPGVLGIVASWLVFYELQSALLNRTTKVDRTDYGNSSLFAIRSDLAQWLAPRWKFIAIRFRVYFLAALVPFVLVVLSIDLQELNWLESDSRLQHAAIGGASIMALAWPLIMMLVWKTLPIHQSEFFQTLNGSGGMPVIRHLKFRRWETGGQIANAAVVGLFSRMRYVFISDVILDKFPAVEIAAIVRHEMGHIRRNHIVWRLGFLMFPVLVLSLHQTWLNATVSVPFEINLGERRWSIAVAPAWAAFLILLAGATWWSNRWLSHQMEHEADLDAIQDHETSETKLNHSSQFKDREFNRDSLNGMRAALLRLAAYAGDDWKRATLFHPSLCSRLDFLRRVETQDSTGKIFRARFSRIRWLLLLGGLVVVGVASLLVGP